MENPIKMDDLGVPLFLERPIYVNIFIYIFICVIFLPHIVPMFFSCCTFLAGTKSTNQLHVKLDQHVAEKSITAIQPVDHHESGVAIFGAEGNPSKKASFSKLQVFFSLWLQVTV